MSQSETKPEVFSITTDAEMDERRERSIFESYVQPCLAELLGTTLFVFVGCSSVTGNSSPGAVQPALAHGLALTVMIAVFGEISGGHFNPAVSLSVFMSGGMKLPLLGPYVLAQLTGGMMGAGLTMATYPSVLHTTRLGGAFDVVTTSKDPGGAVVAEVILTLILTLVVCLGAVNSRTRTQWAPFCIGLTVTANVLAGASVSGACLNPARALGPAVVANHWEHHWVYWVGPACGALLTAGLVRLLFGDQKTRVVLK